MGKAATSNLIGSHSFSQIAGMGKAALQASGHRNFSSQLSLHLIQKICPQRDSNRPPIGWKADALPLFYQGLIEMITLIGDLIKQTLRRLQTPTSLFDFLANADESISFFILIRSREYNAKDQTAMPNPYVLSKISYFWSN